MNIVLVGFMGTGKTMVARLLSKQLGMTYISTDEVIVDKERRSINEIFKKSGEPYFRRVEKEVVGKVSEVENFVIDAGGGIVLDEENVKNLKRNGLIVCLTATPEVIQERTKRYQQRPLLNVPDPKAKIKELLDSRAPFYARADYTIDTSNFTIEQVAEKIVELFQQKQSQGRPTDEQNQSQT